MERVKSPGIKISFYTKFMFSLWFSISIGWMIRGFLTGDMIFSFYALGTVGFVASTWVLVCDLYKSINTYAEEFIKEMYRVN